MLNENEVAALESLIRRMPKMAVPANELKPVRPSGTAHRQRDNPIRQQ